MSTTSVIIYKDLVELSSNGGWTRSREGGGESQSARPDETTSWIETFQVICFECIERSAQSIAVLDPFLPSPALLPFPTARFSPFFATVIAATKEKPRERERERENEGTKSRAYARASFSRGRDALRVTRPWDCEIRLELYTMKYFYTFASRILTVALAVRRGLRNCIDYSLTWIERNAGNWSLRFIDSKFRLESRRRIKILSVSRDKNYFFQNNFLDNGGIREFFHRSNETARRVIISLVGTGRCGKRF